MQGIHSYIPETNHVSVIYIVAAVLYLQLVLHGMLFGTLNRFCTLTSEHAVVQLVEALCYKPEGCGFNSRLCHWNISLTKSFHPHCVPGVDSASDGNEHQEYFLGDIGGRYVGLTTTFMCQLS